MDQHPGGDRVPAARSPHRATAPEYEFRVLSIPRGTTRNDVRRMLTEEAEYGRWELARVRLYLGGARKVWLRRRILRVRRPV